MSVQRSHGAAEQIARNAGGYNRRKRGAHCRTYSSCRSGNKQSAARQGHFNSFVVFQPEWFYVTAFTNGMRAKVPAPFHARIKPYGTCARLCKCGGKFLPTGEISFHERGIFGSRKNGGTHARNC
jgi:hypothetical protein